MKYRSRHYTSVTSIVCSDLPLCYYSRSQLTYQPCNITIGVTINYVFTTDVHSPGRRQLASKPPAIVALSPFFGMEGRRSTMPCTPAFAAPGCKMTSYENVTKRSINHIAQRRIYSTPLIPHYAPLTLAWTPCLLFVPCIGVL